MINTDNYFLIYSHINKRYEKLKIDSLKSIFSIEKNDNMTYQQIEDKIYELSLYILDLSASFTSEHYSFEELTNRFETLSDTINMLSDDIYINDTYQVEMLLKNENKVLIDTVDTAYDKQLSEFTKTATKTIKSISTMTIN